MPDYQPFPNVIGRVGRGGTEVRDVKDNQVARFSVAQRTGFGEGATQWYDVEVWSTRRNGEPEPLFTKVQSLQQGQLVAVESLTPKERTHNEKTYVTLPALNVWRLTDIAEESGDEW